MLYNVIEFENNKKYKLWKKNTILVNNVLWTEVKWNSFSIKVFNFNFNWITCYHE